jgi:hypothetical protein
MPPGKAMHPLRQQRLSPRLSMHPLRKGPAMSLQELTPAYRHAADLLRSRIRLLRRQLKQETDPEQIWRLQRRINALRPMLEEMNELAELTEHYYDRGYYRNEKYTL